MLVSHFLSPVTRIQYVLFNFFLVFQSLLFLRSLAIPFRFAWLTLHCATANKTSYDSTTMKHLPIRCICVCVNRKFQMVAKRMRSTHWIGWYGRKNEMERLHNVEVYWSLFTGALWRSASRHTVQNVTRYNLIGPYQYIHIGIVYVFVIFFCFFFFCFFAFVSFKCIAFWQSIASTFVVVYLFLIRRSTIISKWFRTYFILLRLRICGIGYDFFFSFSFRFVSLPFFLVTTVTNCDLIHAFTWQIERKIAGREV